MPTRRGWRSFNAGVRGRTGPASPLRARLVQLLVAGSLAANAAAWIQEPARNGEDRREAAELEVDGWRRFDLADLDGARECFATAVARGSIEAHRGLAEVYRRQDQLAHAEDEFRLLLESRPDDGAALRELATVVAFDRRRRPEAVELLRRGCALAPDDADMRLRLGCVLAWSGHHGEARAELGRVADTSCDPELARRLSILRIDPPFAEGGVRIRAEGLPCRDLPDRVVSPVARRAPFTPNHTPASEER
jgi:tetratricopeptide (TPR) repeat protein